MKKMLAFFMVLACFGSFAFGQSAWDRPMQLKNCSINIKADPFTATTLMEMEFYNPNSKEIEGLFQFKLQSGQAITGFQLDLNGKYRNGSIEEKRKATNAYNTVVGKRIDPALLNMDYPNHYSLRIYPLPPNGMRKITITIQQLLTLNGKSLQYRMPFDIGDTVENFKTVIRVTNSNAIPFIKDGLLVEQFFGSLTNYHELEFNAKKILLKKPLDFRIPVDGDRFCVKNLNGQNYFAINHHSFVPLNYKINPKNISVYWDVSASGNKRNINKEIQFLKQYLDFNNILQLSITSFNYKIQKTVNFNLDGSNNWIQYLKSLDYDGATEIGSIDLSSVNADAIFLFSDGYNSYGKSVPSGTRSYVYCVHSAPLTDRNNIQSIIGESGGCDIDLQKLTISEAIGLARIAENKIMDIRSASGKSIIDFEWHEAKTGKSLVTGILHGESDTLIFQFGNNNRISYSEKVYLDGKMPCSESAIDRIQSLFEFDRIINSQNWNQILEFGRDQKIVTPHTSFIVLERIEDYVRFNIEPPKEIEAECIEKGYVTQAGKDSRMYKLDVEYEILNGLAAKYNDRVLKWGSNDFITVKKPGTRIESSGTVVKESGNTIQGSFSGIFPGDQLSALEEVVVTAYGLTNRKMVAGSVTTISTKEIFSSSVNVEQALQGRVAGLEIHSVNSSNLAAMPDIRIRGVSSLNNYEPLFVLDGIPVTGNINDLVNVHDINYITVLKDASATALYGGRGSNGVIVITTKKGMNFYNYNRAYKLSDQEDVDYLQELKLTEKKLLVEKYQELKKDYGTEPRFYLDAARYFFEAGLTENIETILSNAAEVAPGNLAVIKAMAFILEEQGKFSEAARLYEHIRNASPDDIRNSRDLALAYYQDNKYQQALDLLYRTIIKKFEGNEMRYRGYKEIMLNDLNAIIAVHKNELDLSGINPALIRMLPVDLRIIIDANYGSTVYLNGISEPGYEVSQQFGKVSKNGGYITFDDWNFGPKEYQIKEAKKGKYSIHLNQYNYTSPAYIKITEYKNFGKPNQSIRIQNFVMDNQEGVVEIAEIKW